MKIYQNIHTGKYYAIANYTGYGQITQWGDTEEEARDNVMERIRIINNAIDDSMESGKVVNPDNHPELKELKEL